LVSSRAVISRPNAPACPHHIGEKSPEPDASAFARNGASAHAASGPRTGAHVAIDGKSLPFFKTGKEMRERLNRPAP
jgi:hypothetical protein